MRSVASVFFHDFIRIACVLPVSSMVTWLLRHIGIVILGFYWYTAFPGLINTESGIISVN